MSDTERLDSLANFIYRMQWDRDNVDVMNKIIDALLGDPGYEPGLLFRKLLDEHIGDHRPTFTVHQPQAAYEMNKDGETA